MDKQFKTLYKEAFKDNNKDVRYFFKKQVNSDNVIYEKDGDTIVSALYLINKTFRIGGNAVVCPYIVGAATREELRGQGIFPRVMKKALERLYDNKVPFTVLYPENSKYYKQFDFEILSYVKGIGFDFGNKDYEYERITKKNINEAYEIYQLYVSRYNFYIKKNAKEFLQDFKRFWLSSKNAYLIKTNDTYFGYYMKDGSDFSQVVVLSPKFLKQVGQRKNDYYINCKKGEKDSKGYAMIRVIDIERFLNLFRPVDKEEKTINIKISDKHIKANDGIFNITLKVGEVRVKRAEKYDIEMTIAQFTKSVLGYAYNDDTFKTWFEAPKILIYDKY